LNISFVIAAFVAIFSVVNPFSKVIFFPMITHGLDGREKRNIIVLAVYMSFLIFLGFALLGGLLFESLGVSLISLRLAGGVIMFKIGWDMLQGVIPKMKPSQDEWDEITEKRLIGVFPLAIPFISGPASIATIVTYMSTSPGFTEQMLVIVSTGLVCLITGVFLHYSDVIFNRIGKVGVFAAMRIMGLIILAMSIEMLTNGILAIE